MFRMILDLIKKPFFILSMSALLSLTALLAALFSEAFLGLEPCILCIYQRIPFAIVIAFWLISFFKRSSLKVMSALSSIALLINSGIATYHTGVEQKWWASAFEGCTVPANFFSNEPQSILENILSTPSARCDEIPWQDPLLGLSMANYNIALCFGLFAALFLSLYLSKTTKADQKQTVEDAV